MPRLLRYTPLVLFLLAGTPRLHAQALIQKHEGSLKFRAVAGSAATSLPDNGPKRVPLGVILNAHSSHLQLELLSITVSWNQLFGEMVEDYVVEWRGSRSQPFTVAMSGDRPPASPTWHELSQHRDLLLRTRQLKPKAIDFRIHFEIPAEEASRIRRGAGPLSGVAQVGDETILLSTSGDTPLHVSTIRSWDRFIVKELTPNHALIQKILPKVRTILIREIEITRLEWPEAEMRAIAEKLQHYKNNPARSPAETIAAAEMPAAPYTAKDALAQPYEPLALIPTRSPHPPNKWGLRDEFDKVVLPFRYDEAPILAGQSALVREGGSYSVLSFQGDPLFGPTDRRILRFSDGFYVLEKTELLHETPANQRRITINALHLRPLTATASGFQLGTQRCVHVEWLSAPNLYLTANDPNLSTAENERRRELGRKKSAEALEDSRRIFREKSAAFVTAGYRLVDN